MTSLPDPAFVADDNRTNQEHKDNVTAIINFISERPGGAAASELTIASGSVTPVKGWHTIRNEAAAAIDQLDSISQTNLEDGSLLIIEAADAGETVIVSHLNGGLGEISLIAGRDINLNNRSKLILIRNGNLWEQVLESRIAAGGVGNIAAHAGPNAPAGGVLCYGQTLAADVNPELNAEIGTAYGGTPGIDIGVPDLRDRAIIFKGDMGGAAAGRIDASLGDSSGLGNSFGGDGRVVLTTGNLPVFSLGAGSLSAASHSHTGGSYTAASHAHSAGGLTSSVTINNGTTVARSSSGVQAAVSGPGGFAAAFQSGSMFFSNITASAVVSGSTALSGALGISGSSGNSGALGITGTTAQIGSATPFGIVQPGLVLNAVMWI